MVDNITKQAAENVAAQEAEEAKARVAAEAFRLEHARQMAQDGAALRCASENAKAALRP